MRKFNLNSVSTPSLQSAHLRKVAESTMDETSLAVKSIITNQRISQIERLMIELMWLNGLRVSELLRIKGTDIMQNGTFIIKASKGSSDRIGFCIEMHQYFISFAGLDIYLFNCYDRHFVYHMFKRRGITASVVGNTNKAVTHSLRHSAIENIQRATNDTSVTAKAIGHKRISSTEHYLNHHIKK